MLPVIMPRQSGGSVAIFMDFPQLRPVPPSEVRGRPATWWLSAVCRCLRTTSE